MGVKLGVFQLRKNTDNGVFGKRVLEGIFGPKMLEDGTDSIVTSGIACTRLQVFLD
jgi:hypothetical protein